MTIQEMKKIEEFVDLAESMKNSYFWKSPGSASSRRSYEKQRTFEKTSVEFENCYEFEANCTASCKNIYFSKNITKNGKKTTLLTLKNVLKKANSLMFA